MKTITLRLTNAEHSRLKTAKEKTGFVWERFILGLVKGGKDGKEKS